MESTSYYMLGQKHLLNGSPGGTSATPEACLRCPAYGPETDQRVGQYCLEAVRKYGTISVSTPPQGEGRCLDVIRDKNILNASTSAAHRAALEGFDGPPKAGF